MKINAQAAAILAAASHIGKSVAAPAKAPADIMERAASTCPATTTLTKTATLTAPFTAVATKTVQGQPATKTVTVPATFTAFEPTSTVTKTEQATETQNVTTTVQSPTTLTKTQNVTETAMETVISQTNVTETETYFSTAQTTKYITATFTATETAEGLTMTVTPSPTSTSSEAASSTSSIADPIRSGTGFFGRSSTFADANLVHQIFSDHSNTVCVNVARGYKPYIATQQAIILTMPQSIFNAPASMPQYYGGPHKGVDYASTGRANLEAYLVTFDADCNPSEPVWLDLVLNFERRTYQVASPTGENSLQRFGYAGSGYAYTGDYVQAAKASIDNVNNQTSEGCSLTSVPAFTKEHCNLKVPYASR